MDPETIADDPADDNKRLETNVSAMNVTNSPTHTYWWGHQWMVPTSKGCFWSWFSQWEPLDVTNDDREAFTGGLHSVVWVGYKVEGA